MPVYGESKKANPNLVDHRTARKSHEVRYSIIIEERVSLLSYLARSKKKVSSHTIWIVGRVV